MCLELNIFNMLAQSNNAALIALVTLSAELEMIAAPHLDLPSAVALLPQCAERNIFIE